MISTLAFHCTRLKLALVSMLAGHTSGRCVPGVWAVLGRVWLRVLVVLGEVDICGPDFHRVVLLDSGGVGYLRGWEEYSSLGLRTKEGFEFVEQVKKIIVVRLEIFYFARY